MAKKTKNTAAGGAAPAPAPTTAPSPTPAPAEAASAPAAAPKQKKPIDLPGFLKKLENSTDASRMEKVTKMLKADRFQLFADVTEAHVVGIVKSQTDHDLFYSARLAKDGSYACCTQNLNVCGGLRGALCKHILVLIIGLAQAGRIDPATIHEWATKSRKTKPVLDRELMGETFIRYKGAQAGEVDWRPTETIPEDYYAL
jgi:hypothetical protein